MQKRNVSRPYDVLITYCLVYHTPFEEEMHSVEVLWQKGGQMDLETLTSAIKMLVLEIWFPMQGEALLFASNRIEQYVSPLQFQKGAKAQKRPLLSCTCQPEVKESLTS